MSEPPDHLPETGIDFALAGPAAQPTPEAAERARQESEAGAPLLQKVGFYLSLARRTVERRPPAEGGRYAILVIEDDADLAQLVIDIFMTAGFEMHWAANRAEVNAEMNRRPSVDLVLLDIVLPDANGLEILKRIRSHPKLTKLPVIMMTGKSEASDVAAGLAAGADGYVSKPFQMSGLVKAVKQVLGEA